MPKSPSCSNSKVQEDEGRVLDAIKRQPELLDTLDQISMTGKKRQQSNWEELALSLDCTADVLKKVWFKARQSSEAKKAKNTTETRPRSARSSSIEPRETRRSLRSQSIDKTIAMASTVVIESTDNSCTNSSCGSPRSEDKRPHHQRTTRRNLRAINEDDINNSDAASVADSTTAIQRCEKEKAQTVQDNNNNNNNNNQEGVSDQQQATSGDELTRELTTASSSALHKFLEETLSETKSRSLRFSEPAMQTPCNSRASIGNNASRRLSVATCNKATRMSTSSKLPNPEDPTRVFFESIGLTVMNFPQHLQASIKVQVSNIVHELEYALSSPRNDVNEKIVAVAS